jgi:hypothetical protein
VSGVDQRELRRLAGSMPERRFSAGSTAVVEGESGIGFFVIVEGQATVTAGGAGARPLGPRDFFGEMSLVTGDARSATVTAPAEALPRSGRPARQRPGRQGSPVDRTATTVTLKLTAVTLR